jgi:hypothetical protein
VFLVAAGLLLLAAGHVGWYQEQARERQSELASFNLFLGSVLAGLPLAIAVLVHRSWGEFSVPDEVGMLALGLLMLATGNMFKLKSTTVMGALLTGLYLLGLLIFIRWHRVQTAALVLTIGGGTLFLIGLVLSVYRDRLLTLPERIRRREGIFQVLNWR